MICNILVWGDGDLSYSTKIAYELNNLGIELFATMLEGKDTHNQGTLLVHILNVSHLDDTL